MSISLGNTSIKELYLGSTKVGSLYLGSIKIYEAAAPAPAVSVWDGTYDYSWYNTTDTSFHLTTCAQFMAFANLCNGSAGGFSQDQFDGKTVYLDASMAINSDYAGYESWASTPPTYSMPDAQINFKGTLDGQFNSIRGAYYNNTSGWGGAALFNVSGTPTLKDVIIEDYYFKGDYAKLIGCDASVFTLEGVIFKNGIISMNGNQATEVTGPCIQIWEGSSSTVRTINMSHCGAYNTVFNGTYKNSGSQVENYGTLISDNRFGSNFTAVHGVANMNNCFVCECDMIPTKTSTSRVQYYKISGAKTNSLTDCFEYDITARYGSNTPSTSVPTAQGTAASSTADLISRYNSANSVDKYTLKSDFTFKGE